MTQPVCIYLDQTSATSAAALARKQGATAHVKVKSLGRNEERPLFVIETEKSEQQKVIDSIANGAERNSALISSVLHCPGCDSIRMEYPERPQVSPTMRGLSEFMEFLGRLFGFPTGSRFRCKKCGHSWDADELPEFSEKNRHRKGNRSGLVDLHGRPTCSG